MKVNDIQEATRKRRRYTGDPPETGGTSTKFDSPAPGLVYIEKSGALDQAKSILDYGAGRYSRNTNYLRQQGFRVYAYDPFSGEPGADGWTETTTKLPRSKFDIAFTAFVLNVVPEYVEKQIISGTRKSGRLSYHITRNMDIFGLVKRALLRGDPLITNWFMKEFATPAERKLLQSGKLTDHKILEFCQFGVRTSRGFQRIPTSEDLGLKLLKETMGWKLYQG